jgi:hypothetical protein
MHAQGERNWRIHVAGEAKREAPMTSRRFPAPWQVEQIPGGFKVLDASGQALVDVNGLSTVLRNAPERRRWSGDIDADSEHVCSWR